MLSINNFAVLALAGTAIAAPTLEQRGWGGSWSGWRNGGWSHGGDSAPAAGASTSTVWDIATATVTMTGEMPTWTNTPAQSTPAAADASPSPAAFYSAPAAPAASSDWATPAPSASPVSATGGYMDVVSKWRAAGGLSALTEDSTLQGNALKTVQDSNGQMVHELNPGSFAQVLAPGNEGNFESVYVGGWLCEVPSEPGLNGICSTMSAGWDHSDGETGHADILTSKSYSKIGCALYAGIWACDLA